MSAVSAVPGCPDTGAARRAGWIKPAVPAKDLARAACARKWREDRGYARSMLSTLSGVSYGSIEDFERGYRLGPSSRARIPAQAWQRYGLICAALDVELRPLF